MNKEIESKFTKEQLESIKNYGKEIKTIELFVDSVRQNPGEYLSSIGNEGWMNGIREVIQNATDEMNRKESTCTKVIVEFFESNNRCIVTDNGRAIPPEDIVRVFTREHTSVNFVKRKGVYSSGLHGVGAKATNAVSKFFKVYSYRLGKGYYMEFSEGKPVNNKLKPTEIANPNNYQGLKIDFAPDNKIMRETTLTCMDILSFLENLYPLLKIGAEIEFIGYTSDKKTVIRKTMVNVLGIESYLARQTQKPMIKPIMYNYDNGVMKCNIAMTYEANLNFNSKVVTFANMTPVNTILSTPSQGFFQGLTQFFRNYMNKIYLANSKRKLEVINSDITTGLVGVIDAAHMAVIFDSQAKNVCKNPEFVEFVKQVTLKALQEWSKNNGDDLQKLCEFIKDAAIARTKLDKEKSTISKKYKTNSFLDYPDKYKRAERKEHLELYITEGDSASSSANSGRDPTFQAVFPIRGKMPNCFTVPKNKFLENKEVQGILTILGAGYGKNFDIEKCPFDKVIILADADFDGFHIRTLLMRFLLMYCRPLIEDGRVYIGLSPLYNINKGKKNWSWFIDKNDFLKYVRDQFYNNNTILHKNKQPFTKTELMSLITNNNKYRALLKSIADNNALHPVVLEDILILKNQSYDKIKKLIEKKYPYLTVSKDKKNNTIIVDGVAYDKTCTIVLNDYLINTCMPILDFLDRSEKRYIVNGETIGLYEILELYSLSEPKNIERAKGLGALDPFELAKSTLNPNNRKLLRYTVKDIEKEIEEMRRINDDKYSLIKDIDISEYEF